MHARWDWLEANFFDPSFSESTSVVKATFTSIRKRLTLLFWEVLNTCMKDRMSEYLLYILIVLTLKYKPLLRKLCTGPQSNCVR